MAALLLAALSGWTSQPTRAAEVCPSRGRQALRFVDVFDGSPSALATLEPDRAGTRSGYWLLGYVFDAGRFVTIRCKYADQQAVDVKLARKVARCRYHIDDRAVLSRTYWASIIVLRAKPASLSELWTPSAAGLVPRAFVRCMFGSG
jgi:hypothetical protein